MSRVNAERMVQALRLRAAGVVGEVCIPGEGCSQGDKAEGVEGQVEYKLWEYGLVGSVRGVVKGPQWRAEGGKVCFSAGVRITGSRPQSHWSTCL